MTRKATILLVRTPNAGFPTNVVHRGANVTLETIFARAGLPTRVRKNIKRFGSGVETFDLAQLHLFMENVRAGTRPWEATALLVSKIVYFWNGALVAPRGVMFDAGTGNLSGPEREGCAVAYYKAESSIVLLRTLAHELGHVFNLLHPPGIGTTLMHPTTALQQAGGFPGNIDFGFAPADVDWLTKAGEDDVRPGGSDFRSRELPTDNEGTSFSGAQLEVSSRWKVYRPGEPVRLRLTLRNMGEEGFAVQGLPTLGSHVMSVRARSRGYGWYELRPAYHACDGAEPLKIGPGKKLMWSELLPADPRAELPGEHELEVMVELETPAGPRVIRGRSSVTRSVDGDMDARLGRELLRPWFRRAITYGGVVPRTTEGQLAVSLLKSYPGARELDELRLSVAAGLRAAGHDAAGIMESSLDERLDLEQRLQLTWLQSREPDVGRAKELSSELGHPSEWLDTTLSSLTPGGAARSGRAVSRVAPARS